MISPEAQAAIDAWEDARDVFFFEGFAHLGAEFEGASIAVRFAAIARFSEALYRLDDAAGLHPSPSAPALRVMYEPLARRWPK